MKPDAQTEGIIKVSMCMIVKDCEADLKRCLDSFLPIIHEPWCELIIVDTGSTDRTIEVAREYADLVLERRFEPWSFSAARNYGIARAVGKRILIVDSDHELTQKSLYLLEDALLNPAQEKYKTMFLKIYNYYSMETGEYAEVVQPLIFDNNPDYRYNEAFAEQDIEPVIDTDALEDFVTPMPEQEGQKKMQMTAGEPIYTYAIHNRPKSDPPYYFLTGVILNHYGYLFEKADLFLDKKERSLPMLEAEHEKNPDDLHILTHLIKTYYACNDYPKVQECGERWMVLMREVDFHEGWYAYLEVFVNILGAYCQTGDGESAERVLAESLKYTDKLISLYLILGQFYMSKQEFQRARELFEEAYLISRQEQNPYEQLCSTNTSAIMPEILNYLALMEFTDGNFDKAGKYQNEGIRTNENRLPLRWDIWNERDATKRLIQNDTRKKQVG